MANNLTVDHMQEQIEYDAYRQFSRIVMTITAITTLLKCLLFIVVLAADIFLIVIICKNAKLKCRRNCYLIHFGAINILVVVVTPITLVIMALNSVGGMIGVLFYYCVEIQIKSAFLSMCVLIGACLCIDWLFETYNSEWKKRAGWICRYSILLAYIIGIINLALAACDCFMVMTGPWFLPYIYGLILVFNIILNIINYRVKPAPQKRSHSLASANVIILSWLPMYIYQILRFCFKSNTITNDILTLIDFIPDWIGYGSPIILLFVLGRVDKDFTKVYIRTFKRKKVQDYRGEDDLDESNDGNDTKPPTVQVQL